MESVAISMDKEASEASIKFEAVFDFSKMDTMIHRFPPGLGEIVSSRYPYMVVPRFVAIGPYHHGKKHLENMEAVKKAAAHFLWQRSNTLKKAMQKAAAHYKRSEKHALDDATQKVVDAVDMARGMYFTDETLTEEGSMTKDNAQFADMMICDSCFLLVYMDAYIRSLGKDEDDNNANESMRRFLFCNRDRINNDIMLLENQLPWRVIQVLIDLASDLKLKKIVEYFIAAMGNSFKIRESSNLKPYEWDDRNNPPPHLLALLRRHKTEEPYVLSEDDDENNNKLHPLIHAWQILCTMWRIDRTSNPLHHPLIHQAPTPPSTSSSTQAGNRQEVVVSAISPMDDLEQIGINLTDNSTGNRQEVVVSAISPMDLAQIGIKLTADPKANPKFSDMGLEKGWLWSHLKLVPLSLDDTGASWLVNMAAFEVCTASRFGDPPDRTAVCSYLSLLAFFMVGSEDVRKLRSMGLLRGPNKDDEILAFFETLKKHLPDYGAHFARVMADVEKYQQKRRIRTTLYKLVYNYWKTVAAVFSVTVAVVTAIAAIIRLYQALLSLIHNN